MRVLLAGSPTHMLIYVAYSTRCRLPRTRRCRVFTDLCSCEAAYLDKLSQPEMMALVEVVVELTSHADMFVRM